MNNFRISTPSKMLGKDANGEKKKINALIDVSELQTVDREIAETKEYMRRCNEHFRDVSGGTNNYTRTSEDLAEWETIRNTLEYTFVVRDHLPKKRVGKVAADPMAVLRSQFANAHPDGGTPLEMAVWIAAKVMNRAVSDFDLSICDDAPEVEEIEEIDEELDDNSFAGEHR